MHFPSLNALHPKRSRHLRLNWPKLLNPLDSGAMHKAGVINLVDVFRFEMLGNCERMIKAQAHHPIDPIGANFCTHVASRGL